MLTGMEPLPLGFSKSLLPQAGGDEDGPFDRRVLAQVEMERQHMPIRIWRRNDPAGARRYKQQSLALGVQLLQASHAG